MTPTERRHPRRRATVSLRRRVTVATVSVFAIVLLAAVGAVDAAFTVNTNRSVTAILTDHVQLAQQLAAANTAPVELVDRLQTHSVRARLVLADGRVIGSLRTRPESDDATKVRRLRLKPSRPGPLSGAQLTLAVDNRLLSGAHTRLVQVLLLVAAAAVLLIAVGIPLIVKLALAPLDEMTTLARGIAAGGRGRRLGAQRSDTELGRAATAFDEMLDALEGAERRALGSEDNMRRFIADAAHELRTPIAGITAATEAVLAQPGDTDADARERLLLVLGREARRAGRLVEDLLDLARLDTGLRLHREPVNLRELAATQVERARLLHDELDLRGVGPDVTASVDATRIGQVIANLVDNACDATPNGGTVTVTVSEYDDAAEIRVIDTGPGVPPAERERIFGRLVRLDAAREQRTSGAGLGLPIARGIARAHGGDLVCEAPGPDSPGAVFVVRLPTQSAQENLSDPRRTMTVPGHTA